MMAQTTLTNDQIYLNALDALDRDTRIDVSVDALLCRGNDQCQRVSVANVSVYGIRVICDFPPLVGEAVQIELAGAGKFEGVVRWQNENEFGAHVFESIDLRLFLNS